MANEIVMQEREIQVQEIATKPSFDFARPECQRATYPRQSLIHEEQGTVLLDVDVNELGQATSAKVTKSSGFLRLDKAIQQFLLEGGCKATPAMLNGKAVKGTAHVTYVWKLN